MEYMNVFVEIFLQLKYQGLIQEIQKVVDAYLPKLRRQKDFQTTAELSIKLFCNTSVTRKTGIYPGTLHMSKLLKSFKSRAFIAAQCVATTRLRKIAKRVMTITELIGLTARLAMKLQMSFPVAKSAIQQKTI